MVWWSKTSTAIKYSLVPTLYGFLPNDFHPAVEFMVDGVFERLRIEHGMIGWLFILPETLLREKTQAVGQLHRYTETCEKKEKLLYPSTVLSVKSNKKWVTTTLRHKIFSFILFIAILLRVWPSGEGTGPKIQGSGFNSHSKGHKYKALGKLWNHIASGHPTVMGMLCTNPSFCRGFYTWWCCGKWTPDS